MQDGDLYIAAADKCYIIVPGIVRHGWLFSLHARHRLIGGVTGPALRRYDRVSNSIEQVGSLTALYEVGEYVVYSVHLMRCVGCIATLISDGTKCALHAYNNSLSTDDVKLLCNRGL